MEKGHAGRRHHRSPDAGTHPDRAPLTSSARGTFLNAGAGERTGPGSLCARVLGCGFSAASPSSGRPSNAFAVWVVVAADRMPVNGMRVPGEAPAAAYVAVVVAPPDDSGGEDRAARPDPAPELVAVAVERVQPVE